jgi:Ser/Thr protein kinase RdoA (MazF antagonist)
LESLPRTSKSWGLIHGDFERTNFTLDQGEVTVFDFDDACYHWYLADAAHALWAFRGAPPESRRRFLLWFLEGYADGGDFELDVSENFSWFVRLRSLSLFVNRVSSAPSAGQEAWCLRQRAAFDRPLSW